MMTRTRARPEAQEQRALFEWAAYAARQWPELRLLHAIPNGGSRDPREARNLKLQGVKAGVPDICLPVARGGYNALYIELKRVRGGRVSDAQRGWLDALNRVGCRAVVCRGFDEARQEIEDYIGRMQTDVHDP